MSRMRLFSLLGVSALAALIAASPAWAKTQVHVIVAHFSDHTLTTFQNAAKRFEAAHPDVEVDIEDVSWDNLQQRLATDIAGGTPPDISVIATRWVLDYVQNNIAEPLDGYIKPEFRSRFYENLLKPGTVDGKTYLLPILASTRALYYNKDLYQKAGVAAAPKTWDDVRAASEKIKAQGAHMVSESRARRSKPTHTGTIPSGHMAVKSSRMASRASPATQASKRPNSTDPSSKRALASRARRGQTGKISKPCSNKGVLALFSPGPGCAARSLPRPRRSIMDWRQCPREARMSPGAAQTA